MGAMSADYIIDRWQKCRTKLQKAKFRCSVLAIPDAGAMQPFSDVEINRMQSGEVKLLRQDYGSLPRFAGIDAGDLYHFVCYERRQNGDPHLVYVEEFDSDNAVARTSELIRKLGVVSLVGDKKPHTNTLRALAYRFPKLVTLQDFMTGSPLKVVEEIHQSKKYNCVKVDRDESLDEMTSDFTSDQFLRIPHIETADVLATFASHLKNLTKERTVDGKGRVIDMYRKGVANHFGMALNSARLAEQISAGLQPFSFTPIEASRTESRSSIRNLKRSMLSG